MRGISEGRLREIANQTHESDDTNHAVLSLLDYLLSECKEIDPWRPIDENTPKDRRLLLFYPHLGIHVGEILGDGKFCIEAYDMDITPTHYQELPISLAFTPRSFCLWCKRNT